MMPKTYHLVFNCGIGIDCDSQKCNIRSVMGSLSPVSDKEGLGKWYFIGIMVPTVHAVQYRQPGARAAEEDV
jgi:hypothetical protein